MATVGIPKSIGTLTEVRANGEVIWTQGEFAGTDLGIMAADEDESHLKFLVPPGTWDFSATANQAISDRPE